MKTRNHFVAESLWRLMIRNLPTRPTLLSMSLFVLAIILTTPLFGQGASPGNGMPLPVDWSFSHVVYTRKFTPAQAARMKDDPRLYNSWLLQGHVQAASTQGGSGNGQGNKKQQQSVDWNFALGYAGVAQNMFPAKFNFNVSAPVDTTNCTSDFVVYGLNTPGTSGVKASDSGAFTAAPNSSQTATINGVVFTASSSVNTGTSFLISGTTGTAANLADAINRTSGTGVTACAGPSAGVCGTGATVTITAATTGTTGNGIAVAEGLSNFTWTSASSLTGGVDAQPNLVALDNLYSDASVGLCGTAPTVKWAYKVATLASGRVTTSPVLSLDGSKVAFVESNGTASVLHVLRWKDSDGTLAAPTTPAAATDISTCTAPCMVSLTYDGSHGTTLSSPYYDYSHPGGIPTDTLYIGNDNGQIFQVTGVFNGTPTLGWTASIPSGTNVQMTGPVLDFDSGRIFIGGSNGNLYAVNKDTGAVSTPLTVGATSGISDAPIVDGSIGKVFAFAASNGSNAVVIQADTATPLGGPLTATIGTASTAVDVHSGTFDNTYINWDGTGINQGHLYMCGATGGATLYQIPFNGVSSVSLTNSGGSGYSANPSVTFSASPIGAAGLPSATATINGSVTSIPVSPVGSGYTSAPAVTIAAAPVGGTTATAGTVSITFDKVASVTVTNGGSGYTSAPSVTFGGPGSGATATATVSGFVSSVTVTDSGSGYSAAPGVTIAAPSGGGTTATATATLTGGVTAYSQNNQGAGYTSTPTVTVGCSTSCATVSLCTGSGATATASMGGTGQSKVTGLNVVAKGSGYNSTHPPNVCFTGGAPTTTADFSATVTNIVDTVSVGNPGDGYTAAPLVTIAAPGGGGATAMATAAITLDKVKSVTVTNGGSGFTSAPTVTFGGPPGSGATASSTVSGFVSSIAVGNAGSGYTSAPGVTFNNTGTNGTGAGASTTIAGPVASVTVSSGGRGYTSAPTVTIGSPGGGGTTATASPVMGMPPGAQGVSQSLSAVSGAECSPISEIFNSVDLLFLGIGKSGTGFFGQVISENINSGSIPASPTHSVLEPSSQGGTSGIVVDNVGLKVGGGTASQAASIYFSTGTYSANSTSAPSRSSGTATFTSTAHNFKVGESVIISGVTVAATCANIFNGTFSVVTAGTNSFTYTVPSSGCTTSNNTGTATRVASAIKLTQSALQ